MDDKRGLLVEQILDDQTAELLRMMPEAPSQVKSPTQVLCSPNPQKSSGCTSHQITLKNKVATKRATCQFCPLVHPEPVENGRIVGFFWVFFCSKIVMILLIFRA